MSGRDRVFSFSGWVTRGFRAFDGSRGMVLGCVLPIRERRLRPWERCARSTPRLALPSEPSTRAPGGRGLRSLRVRALRSASRSALPRRPRHWSGWRRRGRRPSRFGDAPGVRVHRITGTNGKSTVTALAGRWAKARACRAAGNIGVPVSSARRGRRRPSCYVIELSQLPARDDVDSLHLRPPRCSTSRQDHLDRYDSMDIRPREGAHLQHCDTRVVNRDDAASLAHGPRRRRPFVRPRRAGGRQAVGARRDSAKRSCTAARSVIAVRAMAMPGLHNAANGLASHALCTAVGIEPGPLARALAEFKGLPASGAGSGRDRRRALLRRLEGHQRRRDAWPRSRASRSGRADRRRRRQGTGLRAARARGARSTRAPWC